MSKLGLSDESVPSTGGQAVSSSRARLLGILIVAVPFGLYELLSWFDNTTELWPNHDKSMEACFWLAGIAGAIVLTGCIVFFRNSNKTPLWNRIVTTVCLIFLSLLVVFMFSSTTVHLINGWIDFPRGETKTYVGLLRISRAYQTHGKGASRDIQTMPYWSDMNVTEQDYQFMLAHRMPGDPARSPDEIASKGYFCARVTVERSKNALRVLHAGSRTLPAGTVILCPTGLR